MRLTSRDRKNAILIAIMTCSILEAAFMVLIILAPLLLGASYNEAAPGVYTTGQGTAKIGGVSVPVMQPVTHGMIFDSAIASYAILGALLLVLLLIAWVLVNKHGKAEAA